MFFGGIDFEDLEYEMNLLKRRVGGQMGGQIGIGGQIGGQIGGGDGIIETYQTIKNANNQGMLDVVLTFANDKLISLDPKAVNTPIKGETSQSPPKSPTTCSKPTLEEIKNASEKNYKEIYTFGFNGGKQASEDLLNMLETKNPTEPNENHNQDNGVGVNNNSFAKSATTISDLNPAEIDDSQTVDKHSNKTIFNFSNSTKSNGDTEDGGGGSNKEIEIEDAINDLRELINLIQPTNGNHFVQPSDFTGLFEFIQIPGDGNCLFNSIAWWILQYNNAETNATESKLFPKLELYSANTDYETIFKLAPLLRAMVCGFYDGYSTGFKNLDQYLDTIMKLDGVEKDYLLPFIFVHYKSLVDEGYDPILNCDNGYNSGNHEAVILAYLLSFNLFIVNMNNGIQMLSDYYWCGNYERPTIIIVKRNGGHWDVFYPREQFPDSGPSSPKILGRYLIRPLKTGDDSIKQIKSAAEEGYNYYAATKMSSS